MEISQSESQPSRLAWAVLAKTPNGRSEIIKVTDSDDADETVQNNPVLYFKSGPFVLQF
jgi:hypothetical protein